MYVCMYNYMYVCIIICMYIYIKDICTNYNQLSCLISHIRCTKKVWKPKLTQLKYLFYFFVHLLDSIRILHLQLLDYNYMYIHNNLHDQLNYNFHYSLQLY